MKGWKWSDGETVTAQDARVLDPHAAGGLGPAVWGCLRPRRVPRPTWSGVKVDPAPTTLTMTMNKAVQPDLVHRQRAEPDHPDADGLGHHLRRRPAGKRRLHGGGQRLRPTGPRLPRPPVQGPVSAGRPPVGLVGRGRALEAAEPSTQTETRRSCRTRRTSGSL